MKRFILVIMLATCVFILGCTVSKDVSLPSVAPKLFRTNAFQQDSISIGSVPFKEFIKDETVQGLIDTALVKNNDMQIALKNIAAADLLYKQSKLGNFPEVKAFVSASSNRASENSMTGFTLSQFMGTNHIEDFNAGLGVLWEADIWGKIRNKKAGALASFLQTGEAKKAIQTRLVTNIAQGYYNLLMLDDQLEIAKKNLQLNENTLKIVNLQFNSGQVTSLAVEQTQAQKLNAEKLIPKLEQQITLQENALSVLVGNLPKAIARKSSLSQMTIPENLSTGYPSEMLSYRPDIKSAEFALNVANAKVGIATANLYPSLTISASGGINSFKASNWFNIPASLFGMVAGGIAQPIFQRRELKTNVELAKIEREKTVINFRQSVLNAVGEVSDELVKIEKLKEEYSIAEKRVETLQQASKNADLLFKSGMANYLEVITAQGNLLQGELDLVTVKNGQLSAVVGLYRSLGGGWK